MRTLVGLLLIVGTLYLLQVEAFSPLRPNCRYSCPLITNSSFVCFGNCCERQRFASQCSFLAAKCANPNKYGDYKQLGAEGVQCNQIPQPVTNEERCNKLCPREFRYAPVCWGTSGQRQTFSSDCYFDQAQGCEPNTYKGWFKIKDVACDGTGGP